MMDHSNSTPSLSVVIPVYNEEETIDAILNFVSRIEIVNEIVIVDDCSKDQSVVIIKKSIESISKEKPKINFLFYQNEKNKGKGASIRYGFGMATCDVIVIQDADLEYDPNEYLRLIKPIADGNADVVYGSRFIGGTHRVLYFWHYIGNKMLTLMSNMFSNLNLTDMETCYKMFRREILDHFELRSNRFGFEPEFTAKIAKARLRIYELPISYYGRTYDDGKKITWRDGLAAIYHILRYNLTLGSLFSLITIIALFIIFYLRVL
jgi:glycosyltransferase involved in cell wall biosynthesis